MAQAARKLSEDQVPSGGIADFVMSDEEIAALEAEEAREEFGNEGIANFQEVAARMASYGRYGDDTVAHVETGEILVPRALIDQSPELKESIFNHLRELGVENPERYVVGSSENSINPETGLPEFFLKKIFKGAKKLVSGVAKGVKKAFSAVGKILKKVAPVVLPIALAMTPLGPIYGAALGSGIGTLIQGGDLKDAFKSALISGASGAVFSGVSSKLGGGTFTGGVKAAATDPLGRLAQTGAGIKEAVSGQGFGTLTGGYQAPAAASNAPLSPAEVTAQATDVSTPAPDYSPAGKTPLGDPNVAAVNDPFFQNPDGTFNQARYDLSRGVGDTSIMMPEGQGYDYRFGGTGGASPANVAAVSPASSAEQAIGMMDASYNPQVAQADMSSFIQTQAPPEPTSFYDQMKSYAGQAKDTVTGAYDTYLSPSRDMGQMNITEALGEMGVNPANANAAQLEVAKEMVAKSTPGLIRSYAPLAAVGAGAAYLGGAFEPAPVEDPDLVQRNADGSVTTGADLIRLNPDEYMVGGGDPRYSSGQYAVGTNYGLTRAGQMYRNPFARPQMYAAEGGEVYPRRNGGIMPNEGIPNQDSVRALLMPGEFVMTTDAVKGLGGGSMNRGINNMYSLMRNLEAKGQVA